MNRRKAQSKCLDDCTRSACQHDSWVIIKNGEVKAGCIDSKGVGAFKGKIISKIDTLYDDKEEAKNFIDRAGRLGIAYLMMRGFSLGISDLDVDQSVRDKVDLEIKKAEKDSNLLIEKFKRKELKILPGMTAEASLEAQIMNTLASGVSNVSDIIADNIKKSDIIVMTKSGSKGSMINTTQMAAVVGQETILGKRIKRGYMNRTLPHIRPFDLSPMSHGFVSRGFKDGLTPFELFWNIMNGREGLMDKSLRTRKSGYMQRRLINALQDLKVLHDLSVRNANNQIIQFVAGEDGVDPTKSDTGKINWKEYIV